MQLECFPTQMRGSHEFISNARLTICVHSFQPIYRYHRIVFPDVILPVLSPVETQITVYIYIYSGSFHLD